MAPPSAIGIEGVSDTQGLAIPDPLTVNGLSAHRAKAPKLVAGVAAWSSSDMFKTLVCKCNTGFKVTPSIVISMLHLF